jgi:hypothetical protein
VERKEVRLTGRQASAVRKEAARRKTSHAAIVREAADVFDISREHDREFAEASRS